MILHAIKAMARKLLPFKPANNAQVYFGPPGAGIFVNENIALQLTAVWSACRLIGETVGGMPWNYFERTPLGKTAVVDDPVYQLLKLRPNPEMSPIDFKSAIMPHVLLWGNGYAEIERSGPDPTALWLLAPERVTVKRNVAGRIVYVVRQDSGEDRIILAEDMFHIKGMSPDGLVGYSAISQLREAVSLSLAIERYGSSFFGNGAVPGFVLTTTNKFKKDEHDEFKKEWDANYKGSGKGHKTALLYDGIVPKTLGVDPKKSQSLEARTFQILEIARAFRVPPHKLAEMKQSTFGNIEEQNIEFVTDSIIPWAIRLEQEADYKLVAPSKRGKFFTKFNEEALLRGDSETQHKNFSVGRNGGWYTVNEIRAKLNMNLVPGPEGDTLLIPANMSVAGESQDEGGTSDSGSSNANGASLRNIFTKLFDESAGRISNRENKAVARASKKYKDDGEGFVDWVETFYAEQKRFFVEGMATPVMTLAESLGGDATCFESLDTTIEMYASKYVENNSTSLLAAFEDGTIADAFVDRSEQWLQGFTNKLLEQTASRALFSVSERAGNGN